MKLKSIMPLGLGTLLALSASCGGAAKSTETVQGVTQAVAEKTTDKPVSDVVADPTIQIAKGQSVWSDACSMCHGDAGEGNGKALAVVGDGSLSNFSNALELHDYIKETMPKTDPGSLSTEDSAAVTAWILSSRGNKLDNVLSQENAKDLSL